MAIALFVNCHLVKPRTSSRNVYTVGRQKVPFYFYDTDLRRGDRFNSSFFRISLLNPTAEEILILV